MQHLYEQVDNLYENVTGKTCISNHGIYSRVERIEEMLSMQQNQAAMCALQDSFRGTQGAIKSRSASTGDIAYGVSVRSKGFFSDIGTELRDATVGGTQTAIVNMFEKSMQDAIQNMEEAVNLKTHDIVNISFNFPIDMLQTRSIILVSGTVVQKNDWNGTFVFGVSARSKGFFSDIGTSVRDATVGGKQTAWKNMYTHAVEDALSKMRTKSEKVGDIRIYTPSFGPQMAVIVATGTST